MMNSVFMIRQAQGSKLTLIITLVAGSQMIPRLADVVLFTSS